LLDELIDEKHSSGGFSGVSINYLIFTQGSSAIVELLGGLRGLIGF
jgi:hypothetical protein